MTKSQRHKIYKSALFALETRKRLYICTAIHFVMNHKQRRYYDMYNFPEIMKHRPNYFNIYDSWFGPGFSKHGREKRVSVLRQAIEETKPVSIIEKIKYFLTKNKAK